MDGLRQHYLAVVLTERCAKDMTRAMTDPQQIINRGNCCRLLAACLHEPEKHLFMAEEVHSNLVSLLSALSPTLPISVQTLATTFAETSQEELRVDHAALFIGPFGLLAPPYGSIYLDGAYQVQGSSTMRVQHCYGQHGLQLDIREPADHIAIELEFLSWLTAKEAEARSGGDDGEARRLHNVQREFFQEFMVWLPSFSERIRANADTAYYRSLADSLQLLFEHCQAPYSP